MRDVGGALQSLLFLVQAVVLSLSGYASKHYWASIEDPLLRGWALPRLLVCLTVVNVVLLIWLLATVRSIRGRTVIYEASPDGSLRRIEARIVRAR